MCETIQNLASTLVSLETVEVILDQTSKYSSKIPEYWSIIKRNYQYIQKQMNRKCIMQVREARFKRLHIMIP